jgi:hypothetical protein
VGNTSGYEAQPNTAALSDQAPLTAIDRVTNVVERAFVEAVAWGCLISACREVPGPHSNITQEIREKRAALEQQFPEGLPILGVTAPVAGAPEPMANAYSVAFEMKLRPGSYPGVSRGRHFQEANKALLDAMEKEPELAAQLRELGISLDRTPTGAVPRSAPDQWVWHHAETPGTMQLVPKSQHDPSSSFWWVLHPDGRGGYYLWGK